MTKPNLFPVAPLLLVDDEPAWLHSLGLNLEYFGNYNNILTCQDSRDVIGLLRLQKVSVVLLDLMMPHLSGEDLLVQLIQEHPDIPVIVLSGLNQLETAVRCMKLGAFDYYVKTAEPDRLLAGIQRAMEMAALHRENRELTSRVLHQELRRPEVFAALVTRSPRMEAIFRYLEAIAASPNPVLFLGEDGTGKRLLGRTLHTLASADAPLCMLSAAVLTEGGGEALLFGGNGHPGALHEAQGGTLLLTGLQDLPPALQARLSRILLQGEYPSAGTGVPARLQCRLLCTAAPQLPDLVSSGRFRKDLFHRLSTHLINVPPLRERMEDLPLLIDHFLCSDATITRPLRLPRNLALLLATYTFPGNLSELRNLLLSVVRESTSPRISIESFRRHIEQYSHVAAAPSAPQPDASASTALIIPGRFPTLAEARDLIIQEALRRTNGNQSIAARLLGISQPALSIHLKKSCPASSEEPNSP